MRKLAVCAALTLSLSGCVLAPQVIQLNQEATVTAGQLSLSRDALVRVVDDRMVDGRQPEPNELGSCSVRMRFELTVIDGATTFTKPYGANESRRVATAPVKEYNEKWVNEVLDRLWQYMFNDDELRAALGVQ